MSSSSECASSCHLSGMHDERDVAVSGGGEGAEGGDDGVLPQVAVALLAQAQHELHVVDHHVRYVVHVSRVFYCLYKSNGIYKLLHRYLEYNLGQIRSQQIKNMLEKIEVFTTGVFDFRSGLISRYILPPSRP